MINRKHFWTGIECKAGSIETLQIHRKSVILDKLRTYKSLIFVPRISVRNSHQSYIHQSAGLRHVFEFKVKHTLMYMLAAEVTEKSDRLSLCQVTTSVGPVFVFTS